MLVVDLIEIMLYLLGGYMLCLYLIVDFVYGFGMLVIGLFGVLLCCIDLCNSIVLVWGVVNVGMVVNVIL